MILRKPPKIPPSLVLFIGIVAISFSAVFIRFAQNEAVPSLVIAAWRTVIATLILLPLSLAFRRQELRKLRPVEWGLAFISGLMLAFHFASWISSLAYTSIVSSTVLVTTSPLWVGLASPSILGETLSRPLKAGIFLALVGSAVIGLNDLLRLVDGRLVLNLGQSGQGGQALLGNGLALVGAFTAAAYLLIGRRLRARLSLLSYTTLVYGTAALCLLALALLSGHALLGYSRNAYILFLLMALLPQLLGHSSYNWALGFLPAAYVAVAVISEPIGASLLALAIFREIPGPLVIAGSLFIFGGIVMASLGREGDKMTR